MNDRSVLINALEELSRQKPKDSTRMNEEDKCVVSVILNSDKDVINQLTNTETVDFVDIWNDRLRRSLNRETPMVDVLTGFNSVMDMVLFLDEKELDELCKWAADGLKISVNEFKERAGEVARQGRDLSNGVNDVFEVLAVLIQAIKKPGSPLKPQFLDNDLREKMKRHAEDRSKFGVCIQILGGASGNMAYVLDLLGVRIKAHWPYHPEIFDPLICRMSELFERLVICEKDIDWFSAKDHCDQNKERSGHPCDGKEEAIENPFRISICVQYSPGLKIDEGVTAQEIDRVIYLMPLHETPTRSWSQVVIVNSDNQRHTVPNPDDFFRNRDDEETNGRQWPFLPIFANWKIENDTLVFRAADDSLMEKIADKCDYFLLTGVQALGYGIFSDDKTREFVKEILNRQLTVLTGKGCIVHSEIAPVPGPRMGALVDIIKNNIASVGMNTEELERITGDESYRDLGLFFGNRPEFDEREDIMARYDRALHLSKQLELMELYIHGNDVDMVLRKGACRGAVMHEIEAVLFAKGAVVGGLLKRSQEEAWENILSEKVATVLLDKGFIRLLEFAFRFARRKHGDSPDKETALFKQIAFSGYYYPKDDPEDYSVMMTPVLWPEIGENLSTAGAGDITSGVVAVFAGK